MNKKESIWAQSVTYKERETLQEEITVDAAVIGGGMAGILTAYYLQNAGVRTVVLEAVQIGSGQTANTTAKITSQHNLIYNMLTQKFGKEQARLYAEANEHAIAEYKRIVTCEKIDCDFTIAPAYLYTTDNAAPLIAEAAAALEAGIPAELTSKTELPFSVAEALCFPNQAYFHPLKFLHAIAGPLEIYEHTRVVEVNGMTLHTPQGKVHASHIIFCCHYPFKNVPGYYFMRMHQERSYAIALKQAQTPKGMYLSIDKNALSFRTQDDLLILGGGGHRTGENSGGGQYAALCDAARKYYPNSREIAAWSAQDCITLDGIPYIGRFSESTPDWYTATGFQKWGMTSSMVSAILISDLITKGRSPWEGIYSPQRFKPSASAQKLMQDTAQAFKGLSRRIFTPPRADIEKLPCGHGSVVEYDGEKAGVYKNEDGEIFIVEIRCPHLGCQLEWNPDEKSWDCPCHGSRFDYLGNVLDNPAQDNLKTV